MLSQDFDTSCVKIGRRSRQSFCEKRVDAILADYDQSYHGEGHSQDRVRCGPDSGGTHGLAGRFEEIRRCPFYLDHCLPKPITAFTLITALEVAIASYTRRLIHSPIVSAAAPRAARERTQL